MATLDEAQERTQKLARMAGFDLQMFGTAKKATALDNVVVNELSLILAKGAGGLDWAPRNPHARVFGVKGGATTAKPADGETTTFDRLVERVGAEKAAAAKGLWVSSDVEDNIDGDGDGADDYESILGIMFGNLGTPSPYGWDYYYSTGGLVGDLQRAMQMQDIDVRTAAIAAGVDTFLDKLDDVRSGGDGMVKKALGAMITAGAVKKAGKRHSAADMEHMNAIEASTKTIQEHVNALTSDAPEPTNDDATEKGRAAKAKAEAKGAAGGSPDPVAPVAPAATPPAAATPTAESIAKAMHAVSESLHESLDKMSKAHNEKIDAFIATQKATGEKMQTALEASKAAAVAAARQPTATGAGPVMGDNGASKGAASVADEPRTSLTVDPTKTTVLDVVRASRETANN